MPQPGRTIPLPRYPPAPGQKGDQVGSSCSLAPAAVPTAEEVSLVRDAFPGNSSNSSSFAGAGQCSSGWAEHSTWRGLWTPHPLLCHHKPPAQPSTSAGHTEHRAVTSEGWVGREAVRNSRRGRRGQEQGRVAAPGAAPAPSMCRTAAAPHRPIFKLIGFITAEQKPPWSCRRT